MKYLVVIGLVALLLFMLYRRLRPYLKLVRDFLNTVGHFREVTARRERSATQRSEKLVRCNACGTWIPIGRALTTNSFDYCSPACLETASIPKRRKSSG